MKMIKPITVTESVLISSTALEDDYAAWASSTAYVIGDRRIRTTTHKVYECLLNHTSTSTPPENLTGGATPTWVEVRPTNKWAMFDDVIGTATSVTSPLDVELAPGNVSGIGFLELVGKTLDVTVTDGDGGPTVYTESIDLDETVIVSFYDYFFADYAQKESVALTDLPGEYLNARVLISITGSGTVSCGVCHPGKVYDIGMAEYGASLRREDFSKKETNSFGYTVITKRATRKLLSVNIITPFELFSRLDRLMKDMQSEAAIYVTTDIAGYEPMIVYGFAADFVIAVPYATQLHCNLQVEGLV